MSWELFHFLKTTTHKFSVGINSILNIWLIHQWATWDWSFLGEKAFDSRQLLLGWFGPTIEAIPSEYSVGCAALRGFPIPAGENKLIPALCGLHKLFPLLWEVPVLLSGHFLTHMRRSVFTWWLTGYPLLSSVILCASLFPLMHFPMNLSYSDFLELWAPSPPLREIARPCLDSPILFCGLKLYPGSTLGSH